MNKMKSKWFFTHGHVVAGVLNSVQVENDVKMCVENLTLETNQKIYSITICFSLSFFL